MNEDWIEDGKEILFHMSHVADFINNGFFVNKSRSYHNNDIKHKANALKKRRSKK